MGMRFLLLFSKAYRVMLRKDWDAAAVLMDCGRGMLLAVAGGPDRLVQDLEPAV